MEVILLIGQLLDQRRRGVRCEFGGRRVDDGEDGFFLRGERLFECHLALPPRQVLGNELVDVGVDGEMAGRVYGRGETQKCRDANDLRGITGAEINDSDDRLLQHA